MHCILERTSAGAVHGQFGQICTQVVIPGVSPEENSDEYTFIHNEYKSDFGRKDREPLSQAETIGCNETATLFDEYGSLLSQYDGPKTEMHGTVVAYTTRTASLKQRNEANACRHSDLSITKNSGCAVWTSHCLAGAVLGYYRFANEVNPFSPHPALHVRESHF